MNIFYLHEDPVQNAKWHIDKHIVKMPIEYAQLMSTAHRMLDGHMYIAELQMVVGLKDGNYKMNVMTFYTKKHHTLIIHLPYGFVNL